LRGAVSGTATVSNPTTDAIAHVARVASDVARSPRSENTASWVLLHVSTAEEVLTEAKKIAGGG